MTISKKRTKQLIQNSFKSRLISLDLILAILISLILCGMSVSSLNGQILGTFHDDGIYAVVAKSLAEGTGHRIISLPSAPPQTKYPFLYSYLLSWVWRFSPSFPTTILLLKAVNVVWLFCTLLLGYFLYRAAGRGRLLDGTSYVFLLGANPFIFSFIDYTLSDVQFLTATVLGLLIFLPQGRPAPRSIILAAATVAAAYLTRTAGVALVAAGLLHLVACRGRRDALRYMLVVVALISPWIIWQTTHLDNRTVGRLDQYYVTYESPAFMVMWADPRQALQIVSGNLRYAAESLHLSLLLFLLPRTSPFIYFLVAWGLLWFLRRGSVYARAFLVLYVFLILTWPFHPHRYLLPLLPIVLIFLFRGITEAESRASTDVESRLIRHAVTVVARLPVLALVIFHVIWLGLYMPTAGPKTRVWLGQRLDYGWTGFEETFRWIREHTEHTDVLATAYDPMYYLYTGRRAIRPWFHRPETYFYPYHEPRPYLGNAREIRNELTRLDVRYVIVDPLDGYAEKQDARRLFEELLREYPEPPRLVFVSSDSLHKIYSLPRPSP